MLSLHLSKTDSLRIHNTSKLQGHYDRLPCMFILRWRDEALDRAQLQRHAVTSLSPRAKYALVRTTLSTAYPYRSRSDDSLYCTALFAAVLREVTHAVSAKGHRPLSRSAGPYVRQARDARHVVRCQLSPRFSAPDVRHTEVRRTLRKIAHAAGFVVLPPQTTRALPRASIQGTVRNTSDAQDTDDRHPAATLHSRPVRPHTARLPRSATAASRPQIRATDQARR